MCRPTLCLLLIFSVISFPLAADSVYRCEQNGKIVFSDRALMSSCVTHEFQVVPANPLEAMRIEMEMENARRIEEEQKAAEQEQRQQEQLIESQMQAAKAMRQQAEAQRQLTQQLMETQRAVPTIPPVMWHGHVSPYPHPSYPTIPPAPGIYPGVRDIVPHHGYTAPSSSSSGGGHIVGKVR